MSFELDLTGQGAVVTGASSGIGAAIARGLSAAGASVLLIGRDSTRLEALREEIAADGGTATELAVDLCAPTAGARIAGTAIERFGRLDTLVHSAGLFLLAPAEESLEILDDQWQVNVRAPLALTAAALPHLREARGSVLLISSAAGLRGVPQAAAYCATKGAVELLSRSIALEEAANGVRVNTIAPGNVRTPMNHHLFEDPDYARSQIDATPLRRIGEVDDIVATAVLLASGRSAYTTGATVSIDGGVTAG
ncbi:MAG: SDR family oxidoreductase [Thermoleophilaceae bacterium]